MQPAAQFRFQLPLSASGPCLAHSHTALIHQEKMTTPCPPPQHEICLPKEPEPLALRQVPRLRAVVESQAFKNILVDEMDMMVSRAATVIQANWKGYRLRQKLISQMTAAKAIQEAWRRFSTRRLMRSNKLTVKKVRKDEGDIPYHPPQQVRFYAPEDPPLAMVNKETQFPSSDNLAMSKSQCKSTPRPCADGAPRGGLTPQQAMAGRLPKSLNPKYQPCMLTKTVQSCLIRHLEGDTAKLKHLAPRCTKAGAPEPAASAKYCHAVPGPTKTQVRTEVDALKASAHPCPVTKTPVKTCPIVSTPKSPATTAAPKVAPQTCPTPPVTATKMHPLTCPISPMTKPPGHIRLNASLSNTTPQVRSTGPAPRTPPPGCVVTSAIKGSPRPGVPVSRSPVQTGPGFVMKKTSPQTRPVTAMTRNHPQTCPVATPSKTSSQSTPVNKPSPQTRLAAMITKTPAQIRSVAAVLRTLCLVPTAVATSPKCPPQPPMATGIPNAAFQVHLSSPKTKTTVSTKQTTVVVRAASQSYMADGKGRCSPHRHLDTAPPKHPVKPALEVEKMKPCPPRPPKREVASKTNETVVARALSWTKVTENRTKPLAPVQQRAEVVKVHSKVYMPVEMTVTLSQAQLAVPLTKASSQVQPATKQTRPQLAMHLAQAPSQPCPSSVLTVIPPERRRLAMCPSATQPSLPMAAHLMTHSAQPHPATDQSRTLSLTHLATCPPTAHPPMALPEGHLNMCLPTTACQPQMATRPTKVSPQPRPPAEYVKPANMKTTKATCHVCPPAKLSKAPSLAQLITCLAKAPQAHLPTGLTKAQSQAQLATETAKCLLATHPATNLSGKTQSQTLLNASKTSVQFWQHFGTLNTGPRDKPDDRSVAQPHSHMQNKTTQNPHSVATDTQGMLVPLMTPAGHTVCNTESWGDSAQAQTSPPPPVPSQAVSCHEDLAASITSLCAELVAMLGSPEDLRALLAKTLSQGEVRTVLSQALSREVLGASVVKALPQGMLGMALMKALSWGELGVSLSRALSRGDLRPELSKATQGKLAEVLCKTLTEEEKATLSQALCQGELGAVFTQSLAQMAQRTGACLPKATSKTAGSRMTAPAPVEVTCSGSLSVAWGPSVGPVQPRCSKVRPPWKGLSWELLGGVLLGEGDGITVGRPPCLPQSHLDPFLSEGVVTSTHFCPLGPTLESTLVREVGALCSHLYLKPLGLHPVVFGKGARVPKQPPQPPPPGPWQPLVANGVGPSTSQPSVTSGRSSGSRQSPVASRVSCPWVSYRDGSVVTGKTPSSMGSGRSPTGPQVFSSSCRGNVRQCPNPGVHKLSLCGCHPPVLRSPHPSPTATEETVVETLKQVLPSGHKWTSLGNRKMVTTVRNVPEGQQSCQSSQMPPNAKLAQGLPGVSSPSQERRSQMPVKSPSRPQGPVKRPHMSILDELLAALPQYPQNVLAKSFPRGPAAPCQGASDSRSSSQNSTSPSPPSSLTPSEILESSREASLLEDHQSGSQMSEEARDCAQGKLERIGPATLGHVVPQLPPRPLELKSLLLHSTSLALSLQWDSDSSSDYSSGDPTEGLLQDETLPGCRSDLSMAPAVDPKGVTWPAPVLTQLTLPDGGAPSPGQSPEATEVTLPLSQPFEVTGLCSSPLEPHGLTPSLAQPSTDTGMSLSLTVPSADTGVSPTLAQLSVDTGVSPNLMQSSVDTGAFLSLAQSSLADRVSSTLSQPSADTEVSPNLAQPTTDTEVSPNLAQPFMSTGVSPSLAHPSLATRVSPTLAQPSTESGVSPSLPEPFMHYGLPTNFSQPFLYYGGSPNAAESFMYYGGSPIFAQPYMATGVSPNFTQPSATTGVAASHQTVTTGVASSQAQPAVAPGMAPNFFPPVMSYGIPSNLAQPCIPTAVTPGFVQPPVSHGLSPSLAQPFVVGVLSPSLAHVSTANRASPSLCQPSAASNMVPGLLQVPLSNRMPSSLSPSFLAPGTCSNLPASSMATLGALSLWPPSMVCGVGRENNNTAWGQPSAGLTQPYPCMRSKLDPPPLGGQGGPGDNPVIGTSIKSTPPDSTFHPEQTQASKGLPGPMAPPTPGFYQASAAPPEDSGLALGASVPRQPCFRGMTTGKPQGPVAAGLFLNVCQDATLAPMTAWAFPTDVSWAQEQTAMATGMGQDLCPAAVSSASVPSEFFSRQPGPSISHAPLPMALRPQCLSTATVGPPSCGYTGMALVDTAKGTVAQTFVEDSADGRGPLVAGHKPVLESMTLNLPQGSVIRGVGKSPCPESTGGGGAQSLAPGAVVSGLAPGPPVDSVTRAVAPSCANENVGDQEALSSAAEPSSPAPGLPLSSVADGKGPSAPPASVAGGVALRSLLVGISPRPYHRAKAGEDFRVPFLTPQASSLVNDSPPDPEAHRVAQVPPALSRDMLLSQDPGLSNFGSVNSQTSPKQGQVADTVSSVLGESSLESSRSGGTDLGPVGSDSQGQEPLVTESVLRDQTPLFREEAPSQASGDSLVPVQAPNLDRHSPTSGITPVQPLSSARDPPGPHSVNGVPGLQLSRVAVVGSTSLPLGPGVAEDSPEAPNHPPESAASNIPSAALQPTLSSTETTGLHPGSGARTETPNLSPNSGVAGSESQTQDAASGVSQTVAPQNPTQSHYHESPTPEKSYQAIHGSLVSELLEGSMIRLQPSRPARKPTSQIPPDSHKQSLGTVMEGITPIIHMGDRKAQKAPLGGHRVSLAYDLPPRGSQRPLLTEGTHHTVHAGFQSATLTPSTPQGQSPHVVSGPRAGYDEGPPVPTVPHSQNFPCIRGPEASDHGGTWVPKAPHSQKLQVVRSPKTVFDSGSPVPIAPHGKRPHFVRHPKTGYNKISPTPTVPQGPVDTGPAAGQSWNSTDPSTAVRATVCAGAPQGAWHPTRGPGPWDPVRTEALDRKPSAELLVSVRAMEKIIIQAAVTIQAGARGYLVRHTVKVWHQRAAVIQATWRGYRVRRNLARLLRAATIIQATWRGYCIRRNQAHRVLLPIMWPESSGRTTGASDHRAIRGFDNSSEHRCFLSCQPDICSVCQSLGPRVESPPTVVMLVGSQPRTCHVCGHTLSTRVVQGYGQGISGQSGSRWVMASQRSPRHAWEQRAAVIIQATWRGYRTRRQLRQQQSAAKMVQATWRGHYTRSCLTTDALLGQGGPWIMSRNASHHSSKAQSMHWPGV